MKANCMALHRLTAPSRIGLFAILLSCAGSPVLAEGTWRAVVSPDNSTQLMFARDETPVLRLSLGGWGPQWAWVGIGAKDKARAGTLAGSVPFVVNKANGQVIDIKYEVRKSGPRQVSFRYDLSAAKDVPLTMLIAGLSVEKSAARGDLVLSLADGQQSTIKLPLGRDSKPPTSQAVLNLNHLGKVSVALDPPCPVSFDGEMRIMLASELFKQGSRSVTLTLAFPSEVALLAAPEDLDRFTTTLAGADWFAFQPTKDLDGGVIGMADWLDRPAGKHGGVRMVGDHFEFEDHTPVKFWGVNLSYGGNCAPEKKAAEFTAQRFAKYGVNGVRLHKFTYPTNQMGIGDRNDATKMDPAGLDRLDWFAAELKKRGIYFGWSHTFKFHVGPGNRDRLAAYDEIEVKLKGDTYGFINLAEDVQDLMIEMVGNLLKHKNPYTGLTYAEEPALSYIELQNEDDIFFYTADRKRLRAGGIQTDHTRPLSG